MEDRVDHPERGLMVRSKKLIKRAEDKSLEQDFKY